MCKITIFLGLFLTAGCAPSEEWWRDSFIYQIYPRSFKDSNGDGVGDINGITSKLEHLVDLNKSIQKIPPYDNYYVWRNATFVNGTRHPPNNWLSVTRGSAWTWNDVRQQYYLHQFSYFQPDLNFRSSALNQEMKDVLTFWTKRGVDGFRVDAIPQAFEDARFLDEPVKPNTGLPPDDPNTLEHIYTKNQKETYELVRSWRNHLDAMNGTRKIILTESYITLDELNQSMKYYEYGADIAFNFMFVTGFNNRSTPTDFKDGIEKWLAHMPRGNYSSNWVVDNHDNNRVSARFGKRRADQLTMLSAVLPGVGVVYYGDEIGMEDTWLSYNETVDPIGCSAGPTGYNITSRDPARTPFQWDNSTSAGFSTNKTTWLRVNPNYPILNLAAQKTVSHSHYSIFKKLVALKKKLVIKTGSVEVISVADRVLGIVRRVSGSVPVVLLINFSNGYVIFDASYQLKIPPRMTVYVSNFDSSLPEGVTINTPSLVLAPAASVILM
ncbi:alpha-glucosidase-like isoform X2 [Fopius arisanus]|uniref:alpha-glucosidase n=1 Tax=Fopius arisanus TaxID=64838 RepID=A0A9R1T3I3_9HYME|nr:PREDICTED: alpha-glucosidase-like isoform X2 [Fopius arisanus]